MATIIRSAIIRSAATGDGWDVRFVTAGQAQVLHFVSQPSEVALADAITAFELRLVDAAMTETEEGAGELFE